jgi:hypothetical protein
LRRVLRVAQLPAVLESEIILRVDEVARLRGQ